MHMIYICDSIAIFKAGVQKLDDLHLGMPFGEGGVKKVRFELKI